LGLDGAFVPQAARDIVMPRATAEVAIVRPILGFGIHSLLGFDVRLGLAKVNRLTSG
jgi:hypothetical protein